MKIENSTILMNSKHQLYQTYKKEENKEYWSDDRDKKEILSFDDKIQLSELAKEASKKLTSTEDNNIKDTTFRIEMSEEDKMKADLIEEFFSKSLGKKFKVIRPKVEVKRDCETEIQIRSLSANSEQQTQRVGWGLIYNFHESYRESERLSFQAAGIVTTRDGKEINININVNMSREFYIENNLSIRAGDAKLCDPLVINFDNNSAALDNTKFDFDIDCDGDTEQISNLLKGSGFIAYDRNGDNLINDGTELFGPKTGNGFYELSTYDEDKNGWIDEDDTIFNKLRIWTKDDDGNMKLFALGEKGIGAIYTGSIDSVFNYKDQHNTLQAQAKQTGLYLKENGTAGTVQQIDYVI